MKLISFLILFCTVFIASAQETNVSRLPFLGSLCAGNDMLSQNSSFIPHHILTEPGTLEGKWLSSSTNSTLEVRPRSNADRQNVSDYPDEEFSILIQSGTNTIGKDFESSYKVFRMYGIDVDADGREEIVLEHGVGGHGTFVYVEKLEVLTISGNNCETMFACDLNGYLYESGMGNPVSWERHYAWQDVDNDKQMELELTLIPPPVIPKCTGEVNVLLILQHPTLLFKYNLSRRRYEIMREEFCPLASNSD